MEYNKEDIHILLIEKISGTIGAGDEAYVDALIRDEPAVAEMWHSLQITFATPAGQEALDPARHLAFIERMQTSLQTGRRHNTFRGVWYAAAAATLLLGAWCLFRQPPDTNTVTSVANNDQITLQLSNGRVISLNPCTPRQTIQLNNAQLSNNNNTLTYTAAGNTALNTLSVPPGKDYTVLLSDGSEIRLNAATTLSFPFSFTGNKREISINGEAYLKVAKQAGRSFIVHTPGSDIEVLGTTFNVNTYSNTAVAVSLLEGAVKVKAGNSARVLQPGFQANWHPEKGIEVVPFDKSEVLSWLNGELVFHNATLREIAQAIPRWYGITVKVDDPAIANKRFSGVMDKKKPISTLLEHLQKTSEIGYYFSGNVLHFK